MSDRRRVPGEGLIDRMEARTRRRPRLGMSPSFYARLGVEDPWAVAGAPAEAAAQNDGMVFLSAAPYYATLRKLAAARRRRERRQEKFLAARAGTALRAARRTWPGEARLHTPKLAALAVEDMRLPEPPAPTVVEAAPALAGTVEVHRRAESTALVAADPWKTTPFVPARVARSSAAGWAGARLARAESARSHEAAVADLPQQARAAVARVRRRVEIDELAPVETIEIVRRARVPRPVVRLVEAEVAAPSVRPVARAEARAAASPVRAAGGFRAPLSRSPSLSMALGAHQAEVDRAVAGALAAPERGEAMRPAAARRSPPAQRAAARADTRREGASLSASPVSSARTTSGRPVAAPVARPVAAASAAGGSSLPGARPAARAADVGGPFAEEPAAPIRAARRAGASAAALARALNAAPVELEAPAAPAVRRREADPLPTASARLVRTGAGAFARARVASPLEGAAFVGAPVAEAVARTAAPVAEARPVPAPVASATVRAARRADVAPRAGSSLAAPVAAEAAPVLRAATPARPRRSAAVRLAEGSFVPAATVAEGTLVAPRASVERVTPRVVAAPEAAAPHRAPAAELPRATARVAARADTAAAPAAPARRTSAPALVSESAASGVSWAAARADVPAPARASAVPHAAPPSFTLPAPAPAAEAPAPTVAPAASARPVVAVAAPTAPRAGRRAPLAQAVERAVPSAAASRGAAPVAEPTRRTARRTGPLSWARPVSSAPMVASLVGGPRRAEAVARRGVAPAAPAEVRRAPAAPAPVFAAAQLFAQLDEAGLVQSSWSPSTPVRTPDGRFVSARVAQALPGVAVLPAINGPVAVPSAASGSRAATFRTPEVRFVSAPSAAGADSDTTAARSGRTRPTEWVSARSGVGEATAYRGAMRVHTPDTRFVGAETATTASGPFAGARSGTSARGEFTGARSGTTEAGTFVSARRGRAAEPATVVAAEAAGVAPAGATRAAEGPRARGASAPAARAAGGGATRPVRPELETTLSAVATDAPTADAPSWAARSDGTPRVRSAQGLFDSLARATTAEQVVGVIAARAGDLAGPVPMTEPMRAVVEQLRQEIHRPAAAEGTLLQTRPSELPAPEATVLRGTAETPRSSAISRRGSTRPVRSSAIVKASGGADDRVSKLVKRLTDLIHLAETERRLSEAQAQVRMAEDTAAARAEGSAPVGGAGGSSAKVDVEAFAREVLEVVNQELELRRSRRTEDGDESNWW